MEILETNQDIQILHYTEKEKFAIKYLSHYNELIKLGFSDRGADFIRVTGMISYNENHEEKGFLYYSAPSTNPARVMTVELVFIPEMFRGRGIYKILQQSLDIIVKRYGHNVVYSQQHIKNNLISKVRDKVGYEPIAVIYRRPLIT